MDKTSLDRSCSGSPAEQVIVHKSNVDYNSGSMAELGLTLKSANKGTSLRPKNDPGAGANAGSREEMVFVTTDSLSELVWSPHKGLSLKCADCNLADKKGFLWGMVLSPSQSITIGEKKVIEPSDGGSLNSSQMVQHLGCQISGRVALIGSPSTTKSIMPICQTIGDEHKLGTGEVIKDIIEKEEQLVLNLNDGDNHSDKKGKRAGCSTNLQSTETPRTRRKTISSNPEKASIQGLDNGGSSDSSSTKVNEEKHYSLRINPEFGDSEKATSSGPFEEDRDVGSGNSNTVGMDFEGAYKTSTSKQCRLPDTQVQLITSVPNNHEELAVVIHEEGMKKITSVASNVLLERGDSTSENDFDPLKGERASPELAITSHPDDEVNRNECHNGLLPWDEVTLVEASPNNSGMPFYRKKEEEKVLYNAEVNSGILKDDGNSYESVESCNNSTGLILAGKRPWSFDPNQVIGNKKTKKQTHDIPRCTSVQGHGSSFMNWISNMVKGSSKSDLKETTSLDHYEPAGDDRHFMLQDRNQQSRCTSTGFGTVFKALYCSGMTVPETGISNIECQLGEGSQQLELANRTCDNTSIPVIYFDESAKLCNETVISIENQVICGDGGGPSSLPNIPSANVSVVQADHKIGVIENNNLLNIPCDKGKGGQMLYSSSFQNGLESTSEDKETQKLGFSVPNKSSKSVIDRSHTLGSLWITRFCPKVSGLMIDSSECEQNVGAAAKGPTDCLKILSPSPMCVVSIKDKNSCEDCQEPSTEDRVDAVNKKVQNCVVGTAGSFGSVKVTEHTDQKFNSTINTIQPSQKFINSEAMASVFARRLDALRHIMPSEVEANPSHATTTCMFCGIRGHKLQECSEITEYEHEALLKKIDSYDGAEESSCLCIRCFQLNHWAVACPNISSKKRSHSDGSSSLLDFRNFDKALHTPRSDHVTNNEERNPPDKIVCGGTVSLTVSEGKKPMVDMGVRASADVDEKRDDAMILNRELKLAKKDLQGNKFCEGNSLKNPSREFMHNGKQTRTLSSTENVSKEYQITAFYNFVNRQIPPIPRGTFEAINKLRLSRADIFKWRRSPVSLFPLDGFFIRLRLRKWEKELGGTDYYVARINGGLREKSLGSSTVLLSVKIGGFKCLVESRFVSNHDFLEDELLAWWCATLKGGGNLPSEKEIELKLKERKSSGF